MASGTLIETERVIREKLEASGQYGKMRAMIMEAALRTVSASDSDDSGAHKPLVFHPTVALADAKRNGVTELSIVQEYLQYLGLQYTARVLQLEAGLQEVPLRTSAELQQQLHIAANNRPGPCLSALVHGGAAGLVQPIPATEAPADAAGEEGTKAEEDVDDAASSASDHHQPGGENTTYFISKWKKRHFVRHNQVSGQQVQIEYLTDCHTVVLDELDSMTVDDCEGGELVIAACEGSVFLRGCKNMTIHVACKQLRTRDCEHINLHIFASTDPVVEMSHHISFYPFHLRLPGLQRLFAEARLDPKANRFVHVYDFTPTEPQLPTPHFEVHFPDHHLSMEDRYASYGAPECPPEIEALLALRLMPAASSESGKNKSYDIRTGAQVWAQAGPMPVPAVAAAAAGRRAGPRWRDAVATHRAHVPKASAALQAESDYSFDEEDGEHGDDGGRLAMKAGKAFRLSSSSYAEESCDSSLKRRSVNAPATSRPPASAALATATSASSLTARSHSPAVWVFTEDQDDADAYRSRMDEGCGSTDIRSDSLGSNPSHSQRVVLQRRWTLEDDTLEDMGIVQTSSPRVLDNRLRLFSPSAAAVGSSKSGGPVSAYRAPLVTALPPDEASYTRSQTSLADGRKEEADDNAPSGARSFVVNAKMEAASRPSSRPRSTNHSGDAAHTRLPTTSSHHKKREKKAPTSCSPRGRTARSPPSRTASPRSSVSSPPSSSSSASSSCAVPGSPPPPHRSVKMLHMKEGGHTSSPPGSTDYLDGPLFAGLGPLMVVHVDVLPDVAGAQPIPSREGVAGEEAASVAAAASSSPSLSRPHPVHLDPYWGAVVERQEMDTHEREVAALHARLETADQQVRITEQQAVAAAEARAAELVQRYKADERKRRAQFQAALDTLREENRELTAKLEAVARAPAMGVLSATTCPLRTSSGDAATEARGNSIATTSGPLMASAAAVSQAEMTRQLQSIEGYWRDRLRTAERHWEDEMSRQTQQRREALDQVEELVRTVEQLQEELRYTRRQAARLREENIRLCGAAQAASTGIVASLAVPVAPATTSPPEEVSRLRKALREHQHKEAALLAQVESYGEEATRVRLRYEAALQKAERELAAERRRSTEMVKLYGSQLESLHHQLREGKPRSAAR
ncbi:Tubulin binding cofactor C family protein [Leishmania donovani]|uniref:Tubulin binding cofactor C family protein n=1 Tax=Leishmania donovani TaxID=5661 RepID=A0A504Y301_LEIDO|nr:Tubulin binding cofactor C family protein [Leishmania donovani]